MPSQSTSVSIDVILSELEVAVRNGDRAFALQIAGTILQRLATDTAAQADIERRVRALVAALDEPAYRDFSRIKELRPGRSGLVSYSDPVDKVTPPNRQAQGTTYPVWFGTNRKPDTNGVDFTNERNNRTTYGRAIVHVPETHRFGEIGNSWWRRLLRVQLCDDSLRIERTEERDQHAFFLELQDEMRSAKENGDKPHALIFIHGFNVTFKDAAIRAAQIGVDLKVLGATAFFSWPSRGTVTAYSIDEATIEASERAITNFLVDFTANCGAEKVHIVAHSMGNRGFLRALQRISANAEMNGVVKFGQLFLAAPDIDRDVFLDLANLYVEYSERTTLYVSNADKPVHLSSKLHDAPRAGYFTPYTIAPNIDTVAVPDFDIDLLGHGYFAQADALLYDISNLMRHDEPPNRRQRIKAAMHENSQFWNLVR